MIVVVAVSALIVLRDKSDSSTQSTTGAITPSVDQSTIASAGDKDSVGLITDDPTCASWEPIARTLSEQQKNGWDRRDPRIPASSWTARQRLEYDAVEKAMRNAADQTVALIYLTPHRVMRELYEQSVAYWRAYADSLENYTAEDDALALVANSTSGALVWICAAQTYGSADARKPLIARPLAPISVAAINDPANPTRFMNVPSPVCDDWSEASRRFDANIDQWARAVDPNAPASQWPLELQSLAARAALVLQENASEVANMGATSQNPTLSDFASLAAQYQRAYAQAIPSYTPADNYLNSAAADLVVAINQACRAALN
ncbi:hypothetical protein [Mycobacterium sp. NAZ190054]|uniref:hypothetical protein n=1 Tax=Mycobacterium sp. NAZ190054 TaxID=1747766 RepID=UPI0012E34B8A|nr:hypothetical protein [Mycobacterium sp. NAZ190054]